MAADFDKPTVSNTHVNVLSQLRDNQTSLARMFSDGGEANIPLRSVRFLNNTMYLWNGSIWEVAPVAIGGGGTGAETAANARANLGTNNAANIDAGVFDAARIPTISIADKTSGTLDGDRVDQSTTSERGTVQLNNTLTSTSTTQALTAAQGKVLGDDVTSISGQVASKLTSGTAGSQGRTNTQNDARFLIETNNLSDLTSKSSARTNLGISSGDTSVNANSTKDVVLGSSIVSATVSYKSISSGLSNPCGATWSGSTLTLRNNDSTSRIISYIAILN